MTTATRDQAFVAVQEFSLNFDNGAKTVDIKRGDLLTFDGLYAEVKGERGMAKSLSKVVNDWVKPYTGDPSKVVESTKPQRAGDHIQTRNATAGQIVENSNVSQDPNVRSQQVSNDSDYEELQRLVAQSDVVQETTITDDQKDMAKEAASIESYDDTIVAQVSDVPNSDITKNTSGVQIEEQKNKKAQVIFQEEEVAMKTNYSGKKAETSERKKLVVDSDSDSEGVIVKKVTTPAVNANEVTTSTIDNTVEVYVEENVAKETSYENGQHTDIGSSTQAQVESSKKASTKKASTKKAFDKKRVVVTTMDQEAVVVGKASKVSSVDTKEGITSKMTVGPSGETDVGEVEFSSNSEVSVPRATVGSGNSDSVVDVSMSDDGDIDINSLLGD